MRPRIGPLVVFTTLVEDPVSVRSVFVPYPNTAAITNSLATPGILIRRKTSSPDIIASSRNCQFLQKHTYFQETDKIKNLFRLFGVYINGFPVFNTTGSRIFTFRNQYQ
jgi:hypothetical protein